MIKYSNQHGKKEYYWGKNAGQGYCWTIYLYFWQLNGFVRGASMGLCGDEAEDENEAMPVRKQPMSNGAMASAEAGMRDLYLLEEQISLTVNGKTIVCKNATAHYKPSSMRLRC